MGILKINIKDVLDFCWCPKYYDLKHQNPDEYNLKELYDETLHGIFYEYLREMQLGTLDQGIKFLKKRWGQKWVKQKTNSQIICTPSAAKRDTYDSKRKAGIDAIITFDEIMNTPQFPIIINRDYEVQVSKNIILCGTFEYVREVERQGGGRVIQLMKFRSENNRFQVDSHMHHDLELTAAALAFKTMFNVDTFELVYVDIYKKKMMASYRSEKDFELLKETVRSVVLSLKNKLRCTSPDKRCYHCEYRNACKINLG